MDIDTRDNETISYLIGLEKDILSEYNLYGSKQFSKEKLMALLNMESDLLNSLNLDSKKLTNIQKYIENKIGVSLDFDMMCGTSPFMTDVTYPYFRMIARVRHLMNSKSENIFELIKASSLDLEVSLLYKSLFLDGKKHHNIEGDLQRYALMILVDSPKAEYEILKNDMKPLDMIDDTLDFQVDFWAMIKVKRELGLVGAPSKNNVSKVRRYRFSLISQEVGKTMSKYFSLRESGQKTEKDIMMCVSYIKSLIACLSKEARTRKYDNFVRDNKESLVANEEYAIFIESSIDDIETKLVPSIRKVSIGNSKLHD